MNYTVIEQEKKAREVFEMLDANGDGQLSEEELIQGYIKLFGDLEQAKREVTKIMDQLDMNKNGTIDYNEFLIANFQKQNVMNNEMMRRAFNFFDEVLKHLIIGWKWANFYR